MLEFVAREIAESPVLIVGTYRDVDLSRQHPLSEALAELARERHFFRIALGGLASSDVALLIEQIVGSEVPAAIVSQVSSLTRGSPFFVTEIARELADETRSRTAVGGTRSQPSAGPSPPIPEGVREAIGRRLNRLSSECISTLRVAAIVGGEFGFELLEPLVDGVSEEGVLHALDEAHRARIIEEAPSPGFYQFSHALIQQTLAAELSTTRRVRLHARIAEALETLYGNSAERHAGELVHHFVEAESELGSEQDRPVSDPSTGLV